MMEFGIGFLFFAGLITGAVGLILGMIVNKAAAGFLLGAFLGPIGWIIVFLLPRDSEAKKEGNFSLVSALASIVIAMLAIAMILTGTTEPVTLQEESETFEPFSPSLSIGEVMNLVTNPAAEILRETISTGSSAEEFKLNYPTTESGWEYLLKQSALIIEAGNMLAIRPYYPASARPDWQKNSRAVSEAGVRIFNAVNARDREEYKRSIEELNSSCSGCHNYY